MHKEIQKRKEKKKSGKKASPIILTWKITHKNKCTLKGAVRAKGWVWNKNAEALKDVSESPTAECQPCSDA